jgi:hypothetical protein
MSDGLTKLMDDAASRADKSDKPCLSCGHGNSYIALRCSQCKARTPLGVAYLHEGFRIIRRRKPLYHLIEVLGIVGALYSLWHSWKAGSLPWAVLIPSSLAIVFAVSYFREVGSIADELERHGIDPWN